MTNSLLVRLALATLIATSVGFAIHVYYGHGWAQAYVDHAFATKPWKILHEPYPAWFFWISFVTKLLPLAGMSLIYLMLRDRLPGGSAVTKGLCFGLLFLFCTDDFIRLPFLDALGGNPMDVVIVQGAEHWLIYPLMGIAIAVIVGDGSHRSNPMTASGREVSTG